jgi:dipeptidyl aminopeptidase/acylaminoacyl peptidase
VGHRGRLFAFLVSIAGLCASAAHADCGGLMPGAARGSKRGVEALDIIQLREIGYPDASLAGESPLAVSPDGKSIAFVMARADVANNNYCRGLILVSLESGKARLVDAGGEFISLGNFVRGLWVDVGFPKLATPVWSPDGRSLAVLKRERGVTQATIVRIDGSLRTLTTHSPVDVEDLRWDDDGRLFVTSRPTLTEISRAADTEGEAGWLYDARMAPNYGPRPRVRLTDAPLVSSEVDPFDGSMRPAASPPASVERAAMEPISSSGARAWLEREGASPFAPQRLWATDAQSRKVACGSAACRGHFLGLWWDPRGREIRFLRREGWNQEVYAFYRWRVSSGPAERIFASRDVIQNCVPAGARFACTLENSTTPPRIILIDPATGGQRTIFDPNPEFEAIRLGEVQRLYVRNDRGLEAWGDLVLPPGTRKGSKLPLILVQYNSRGFLRGGTGNEYPIYPLAARGFAVLSLERPRAIASANPMLRTDVELNAANEKDWAERKSMLSATLAAIDAAIATGTVDPTRIGITGLSDGATSVRFALINSHRFAAAAISSCCLEPKTVMTYGGIAWAEFNRAIGYPPASLDAPKFWAPASLALNADKIRTPLLMQLADDEYLLSLEAFEALRERGAPIELYVFPGEHHIKWQPRHKLALFERTADWFSFWLRCAENPGEEKKEQYRRWETIRLRIGQVGVQCPPAVTSSNVPRPPRQPAS